MKTNKIFFSIAGNFELDPLTRHIHSACEYFLKYNVTSLWHSRNFLSMCFQEIRKFAAIAIFSLHSRMEKVDLPTHPPLFYVITYVKVNSYAYLVAKIKFIFSSESRPLRSWISTSTETWKGRRKRRMSWNSRALIRGQMVFSNSFQNT